MTGERMGEMIGRGIVARLRGFFADYWMVGVALASVGGALAIWISM